MVSCPWAHPQSAAALLLTAGGFFATQFKEVTEAYEVLSDPKKRVRPPCSRTALETVAGNDRFTTPFIEALAVEMRGSLTTLSAAQEVYDSYGDSGLRGEVPTGPGGSTFHYTPGDADSIFEGAFEFMYLRASGTHALASSDSTARHSLLWERHGWRTAWQHV